MLPEQVARGRSVFDGVGVIISPVIGIAGDDDIARIVSGDTESMKISGGRGSDEFRPNESAVLCSVFYGGGIEAEIVVNVTGYDHVAAPVHGHGAGVTILVAILVDFGRCTLLPNESAVGPATRVKSQPFSNSL